MINKKAKLAINKIVILIIAIIVLIVIVIGVVKFDLLKKFDIFPDFFGNKNGESVEWNEEIFLESPEKLIFEIKNGRETEDLKYWCSKGEGWKWNKDGWISVDNSEYYLFKELNNKNQNFIKSLRGKNCEQGLELLIKRVKENDEGNWWHNINLVITAGKDGRVYSHDDSDLNNINAVIVQINKITR